MNKTNMSEDELDDLFRKSASAYEPEFDEAGWDAMENKLEAHLHQQFFWRKLGWASLLILLVGVGTFLGVRETEKPKSGFVTTQKQKTPLLSGNKQAAHISVIETPANPKKPNLSETKKIASHPNPPAPVGIIRKAPVEKHRLRSKEINRRPDQEIPKAWVIENPKIKKPGFKPGKKSVSLPNQIASGEIKTDQIQEENPLTKNSSGVHTNQQTTNSDINSTPVNDVSEIGNHEVVFNEPVPAEKPTILPDSSVKKFKKSAFAFRRFVFTVLAAPDLSSVGLSNPGGISTNGGGGISYFLTGKWSISAGLVRARKIYTAQPEDYKSKPAFWKDNYKMEHIDAICQVLDIPVNIGYQVWQKNKSALTVSTGLSSYLMQNERYDYGYYYYGKEYYKTWEVANQNQHLFSIYNLSVKYARQLSGSLSIGAEPFLKVPLAGVGAGKVKLASAGVFFSLNYRHP